MRFITDGRGADVVLEIGGAATIEQSLRALRPAGLIAVIGARAGATGGGIDPGALLGTHARLQVMSVGSRANFTDMARAIDLHRIRPVISRRYPGTEAPTALAALRRGGHFGKIVLDFPA